MLRAVELFHIRFRSLHHFNRIIDALIARMSVTEHHFKTLVPGELLNGLNVGSGLRQVGDRCVPHGVWDDLARIESGSGNTASECLLHAVDVAGGGIGAWKNPPLRVMGLWR